jgi:hypothetical protein
MIRVRDTAGLVHYAVEGASLRLSRPRMWCGGYLGFGCEQVDYPVCMWEMCPDCCAQLALFRTAHVHASEMPP